MSNNKKTKNQSNNFPFANEIKKAKDEFKKMIDEMTDEEFLEFSFLMMQFTDDFEDDIWDDDEGWEDEAEKFYHSNNKDTIYDLPFDDNDLPL